jgi:transposase-like protein
VPLPRPMAASGPAAQLPMPPASPAQGPAADTPPEPPGSLRLLRSWIDVVPKEMLWEHLRCARWPKGVQCPHCGEQDPQYVRVIDAHYRDGGMQRYRCQLCTEAGDPGEGGTFTDLSGTLFEGQHLDIRSFWLVVEHFVSGIASVQTADDVQVNRHTTDRLFRLFRGAIFEAHAAEMLVLDPDSITEMDEVYVTAGLKGHAGRSALERPARKRGLKRCGRGDWESDRIPVFGLLQRQGEVRLFVLPNVQTETIRPIIERMVCRGAKVYTDSYSIYNFLRRAGYRHETVNHGAGEYARGEVHCNTMECTWSWLRQDVRTYRGVSKIYLPLYVAQFEFFHNRRHQSPMGRAADLLQVAFAADAEFLRLRVEDADFAEVCPMPG